MDFRTLTNIEHRSEEKRKKCGNPTLQRLNPDLPVEAIEGAVEVICRDFFFPALSLAKANREIGKLRSGASKPEFGEVFA